MTQSRPPLLSIFLLSACSLAYEILLMRLFSIIQWHHFAYMIISLALLGYGVSGSILSVFQQWLMPRFRAMYISAIVLFSVSSLLCFLIAQAIPFNAEEMIWDIRQPFYLLLIFIVLSLPFFFAASAICLSFMVYKEQITKIYAMDMLGAGIGSIGVVLLLYIVFPIEALVIITATGLVAAIWAIWELKQTSRRRLTVVMMILVALLWFITPFLQPNISPYKSLSQLLQISGTEIIAERSSPLGQLTVVKSTQIPLRHAPGLSLNASTEPLSQLGIFTDADNMTVITQTPEHQSQLAYLDQVTWALPYHLKKPDNVLILGAGGGADVLQARYHSAGQIDAVELNPQLIELVKDDYRAFAGNLYTQANVNIHIGEARDFISKNRFQYNLIQLALLDASNSGLYALNESYLYTTEALDSYLDSIRPGGYLAITRWIRIPPREALKLFATAVHVLSAKGINNPEQHLVLIRSWQTSTLLVKNTIFTTDELKAVRQFCTERAFDIAYAPDIKQHEINRYNVLRSAIFHHAAQAILGDERDAFLAQYKFNLEPATDDRPYFHQFFKWSVLPEILELRGKGGLPLLEWGYLILVVTFFISILSSLLLILAPLNLLRHDHKQVSKVSRWQIVIYFFAVGFGFMFIEIAFIQRFIQFLHHPLFAIAVVLTAFLVFAGLGSHWSGRLLETRGDAKAITIAVMGIIISSVVYLLFLGQVFNLFSGIAIWGKIFITMGLIAPLAIFMGMPFPLALKNLSQHDKSLVPWAWGINGCASVISAVLATILAVHFGFTIVVVLALLLYLLVLTVFPRPQGSQG